MLPTTSIFLPGRPLPLPRGLGLRRRLSRRPRSARRAPRGMATPSNGAKIQEAKRRMRVRVGESTNPGPSTITEPVPPPTKPAEDPQFFDANSRRTVSFLVLSFFGLAYVLQTLPGSVAPVNAITGPWKYGLIATHIFAFALIPVSMRVFHERLPSLNFKRSAVFASQLGLSFIMVAIASEIGWHVTQTWYYTNDYTILNFMFYFFLLSAFALWADSLAREDSWKTEMTNIAFALGLVVVSVLYPVGASMQTAGLPSESYKIPIYVTLTLIFAVLTYRGYNVLQDKRVLVFPFLSVGVNLFFVYLLTTEGETIAANAKYHILHDLLGTEAGLLYFTWLFYKKTPEIESKKPE